MGTKTEHPILFTGDMVRAILDGRKTQTRRVIKPQPANVNSYYMFGNKKNPQSLANIGLKCPYGVPGDLLWVREPFRITCFSYMYPTVHGCYTRDDSVFRVELTGTEWEKLKKWRKRLSGKSSLFMFKSLARIWLKVNSVRVERLREISDEDIICEGFECREDFYGAIIKINKAENPEQYLNKWCWVVEFERYNK